MICDLVLKLKDRCLRLSRWWRRSVQFRRVTTRHGHLTHDEYGLPLPYHLQRFKISTFVIPSLFVSLNVPSLILLLVLFQIRVPCSTRGCLASPNTAVLHMMMPVGIPLDFRFYQRRDERRDRSRPQSQSSTIGDETCYDCNRECD